MLQVREESLAGARPSSRQEKVASSAQGEGLAKEQVSGRRQSMRAELGVGGCDGKSLFFPDCCYFQGHQLRSKLGEEGWRLETVC